LGSVEDIPPPQAIPQLWPPKLLGLPYRREPNFPAQINNVWHILTGFCFWYCRTQTKQSSRVSRLPAAAGSADALLHNGAAAAAAKLTNGGGANGVSSSDEDMETN
jgi:hypothetical protein